MSNRFNKAALLSGGAIAAMALATPALAQQTTDDATDQETASDLVFVLDSSLKLPSR